MNAEKDRYEELIYRKRPVSAHIHMDIGHRAKQFAPFAALEGFEETIRSRAHNFEGDKEDNIEGNIDKDVKSNAGNGSLCNLHKHRI